MKKPTPANLLGAIVRDYFTDHLPRIRGSSPHTIHSYRDSIVLLLRFVAEQRKIPVAALDLGRPGSAAHPRVPFPSGGPEE